MPDPNNPIFFPELNGTNGSTCGDYSFGWTSGCTYSDGTDRGFTQDWYYDGGMGAWVSSTRMNRYSDVTVIGTDVSLSSPGFSSDISFNSETSFLGFAVADPNHGVTLTLVDPPPSNSYQEINLIVDNPGTSSTFEILGKDISGSDSSVYMDRSLSSSAADGLTYGIHKWKIWTVDGGSKYYVYRANGFGRFWDDS
jgi:hypothetical protein